MIVDVNQHMAQPGLGVDTVEFGGADQRVDRGGTLATAVGTSEQVIAPTVGADVKLIQAA